MKPELIESLGYMKTKAKRPKLFGVYACPDCGGAFKAATTNINTGNTTRCSDCAAKHRAATRTKWSIEELMQKAGACATRQEFKRLYPNAYSSARKRGLLDEVCAQTRCGKTQWDKDSILSEAAKYRYMDDFQKGSGGAYVASRKLGIASEVAELFDGARRQSDNDVVYIWQIISPKTGSAPLYKVGVTSERLGTSRIRDCAKAAGFCYNIVAMQKVSDARNVEKRILSLGEQVSLGAFNGHTEVVSLSATQLSVALEIIESERGSDKHANGVSENAEV